MLRWIVLLLVVWWLARLVGRLLNAVSGRAIGRGGRREDSADRTADLSRQEIADADFEEIPEEE